MPDVRASVISSAAIEHLRWSLVPQIGPILFGRLLQRFGSAGAAFGATAGQLADIQGIGQSTAEQMARDRHQVDVQAEVGLAADASVRIICREDPDFPEPLKHIPDPPICLYVRGQLERTDALGIAVVGSRRCTMYGREQAYRFGYQLASAGMTVVSGMARGVDMESHKGALAAHGRTLAVLGNGLGDIYPPEHRDLADRISENGALISELPMTTSPQKENFLPRNRLIAGLSLGVVVIEAARRSGSLSTAARASEYNREVFAVPGRIDSDYSSGTNALIRDQHAKLVTCVDDVLEELGEAGQLLQASVQAEDERVEPPPERSALNDDEKRVFQLLDREEQSIEIIAEASGQSPARVASTLITLQLKGLVRQMPGNLFIRARQGV